MVNRVKFILTTLNRVCFVVGGMFLWAYVFHPTLPLGQRLFWFCCEVLFWFMLWESRNDKP